MLALIAVALPRPCVGKSATNGIYRLETDVYVFKDSEVKSVKLPAATAAGSHGGVVIQSPAQIEFGRETLSLNGPDIGWSGGRNPPEQFTLITAPTLVTAPGKPVEILAAAPIQYIEREADGTLQARNIGRDSPDAPHCRMRFAVASPEPTSETLRVSCDLDLATVAARANVPGVTLDVGRPLLAHFQDRFEMAVRAGAWAAFLLRTPNGNAYSLLLLVKTTPANEAEIREGPAGRLMTAEELAVFLTYYYRHPQPELISKAIESLAPSDFLDQSNTSSDLFHETAYTCVGFFAEVFAANPDRVAEWEKLIDGRGQDGTTRYWLRKAMRLHRQGAILPIDKAASPTHIAGVYMYWGAFFASGNPAYLQKLVDQMKFVDDVNREFFEAGGEAIVLFAYNAPHHPLVRQTLEAERKNASPRIRQLISDLLTKDFEAVLREVRGMDHNFEDYPGYHHRLPWRIPFRTLVPDQPKAD